MVSFLLGRVFGKKGCGADGDTMEECVDECDQICYKDRALKDQKWSAYIDRSPGAATYSEECFHACVSVCGFKFDVAEKEVEEVHPNRPMDWVTVLQSIILTFVKTPLRVVHVLWR